MFRHPDRLEEMVERMIASIDSQRRPMRDGSAPMVRVLAALLLCLSTAAYAQPTFSTGPGPPPATGLLGTVNTWTAPQKTSTETPAISTATFTPLFNTTAGAAQNHRIVLVHASCPCTLANPASLGAGQSGMFEIVQSATGSDLITTYGSNYIYVGGTSSITLSTGANTTDYLPYYVDSTASFIVLGGIIKGPAH